MLHFCSMKRNSGTGWRQSINNQTKKYETLLTDEAKICIIHDKINTQRVVKDAVSLSAVSFSIHWPGVQLAGSCHSWFHAIFIVAALGAKSVAGKTLGGRFSTPLSSVACCKCVSRATRSSPFPFQFQPIQFAGPGQNLTLSRSAAPAAAGQQCTQSRIFSNYFPSPQSVPAHSACDFPLLCIFQMQAVFL